MVTPNLFQPFLTQKVGVTQIWKVIGKFEVTNSITNSKTFNFATIDFDSDSMIALEMDLSSLTNIDLIVFVNGITSGVYFQDGSVITTFPTAETIIQRVNDSGFRVPNFLNAGRNSSFIFYFQLNKAGSSTFVGVEINANRMTALAGGNSLKTTGKINQNISSISSITIEATATRFFSIGSRMSLYKVSR